MPENDTMISICIPIHNGNVRALVHDLKHQADTLAINYEILLIDDASDDAWREQNRPLETLKHVRYIELSENIGRSAIRNLLAKEAVYRYLIFMDCDAQVCSVDFIEKYLRYCFPKIVCYGGKKNLLQRPASEYYLRWHYSVAREEIDAQARNRFPNRNFITFNFLIDKKIFELISFDEQIKGYGHEDTLFGIRLAEHNITVTHIDNQLLYAKFDRADMFVQKTEQGIRNLIAIQKQLGDKHSFTAEVKLLSVGYNINRCKLAPLVRRFFKTGCRLMLRNLLGKHPSLFVFDLYKLGYLCSVKK
jgi:glycosyltransferase involved in cell wall biosynthesis